jgi:DtxR family Mn-dependent transcriptional regulator
MHSVSEENYIKALYHLQRGDKLVSTNDIAGRMRTRASSVTDMLKKLADKNLVDYIPYKGSKLTSRGHACATQIIRKHRLWELFLVAKLNFTWDEVHEVAEQLEHIQSHKLINEIDKLLDYPTHDPHGDPIPNASGLIAVPAHKTLSELQHGESGALSAVADSSALFLQYLDRNKLEIGSIITLHYREALDNSCTILTVHGTINLSEAIASKLWIMPSEHKK